MIYKFYIEDLYITTEIVEPRNWKDLQSVFSRDFKTHGVFFDYTDGTLKLGFSCEARDLLEAAYQASGVDAYYLFKATKQADQYDSETEVFSGQIDFSRRKIDHEFFEAEVNSSNDELKIKNRKNISINLNAQKSLDGVTLSKMYYDDSIRLLGSKPLAELDLVGVPETLTARNTDEFGLLGYVGLENNTSSEIDKFRPPKNALDVARENVPYENAKPFLELDQQSALQMTIEWDIDYDVSDFANSSSTHTVSLWLFVDPEGTTNTGTTFNSAQQLDFDQFSAPGNGNLSGSTTLYGLFNLGTTFSLTIRSFDTATNYIFDTEITINSFTLNFKDVFVNKGDKVQWYNVHDAINKNLNFLTGNYDFLYSELLGSTYQGYAENGCLSTLNITNGFRIRGKNDTKKAPDLSFENFFINLSSMYGIGYGIEDLESPLILGSKDIEYVSTSGGTATIRIYENLASDIPVGSNLGLYNSEDLNGVYEVTASSWSGTYTEIELDVSTNNNFYDGVYSDRPVNGITYEDVVLSCDDTTEVRERLRIEKWEHFYQNTELIDLGIIEEYSEEPFDGLINQIGWEFKKYSNDERRPLTLEDFHTKAHWSIPIENTEKSKLNPLTWIGSTGLITESKLSNVSKRPTTANKLDEDIFFCDKIGKQITETVDFVNPGDYIVVPDYVYTNFLYGADSFTISGSTSNDGTYNFCGDAILDIETEEYRVYVCETLTNDTADSATFTPNYSGQEEYKPEANENLTSTSNLTDPAFTYNQRRSIKRMLLRWGTFIRSLVSFTPVIGELINLLYVYNGEYTSTISTSVCYESADSQTEEDNVNVSTLNEPKFKPNIINFTKKICDSDYTLIKSAHRNSDIYNRNYGYITITNKKGESKTGWLLEMNRSPIDRVANFRLIERSLNLPQNIGTTSVGNDTTSTLPDAQRVFCTVDGTVNSMYFHDVNNDNEVLMGIYDDVSGQPQNLLATTLYENPAGVGWKSLDLVTPINVSKDTYYWIAIVGTNLTSDNSVNNGSLDIGIDIPPAFQNPCVVQGSLDRKISCYFKVE